MLDVDRVNEIANFLLCAHDMDPSYLLNNVLDVPNTWAAFLPVCSVLGGILGQEVIKVMTKVGAPMNNFFVFSSLDFCGRCFILGDSTSSK